MPPFDPLVTTGLNARQLLDRAEACMGVGGSGNTAMTRWAAAAIELAQIEGDALTEALAQFYALLSSTPTTRSAAFEARLAAAVARCRELRQPRGLWLLDDLQAWTLMLQGRHFEAMTLGERLLRRHDDERPPLERSITLYFLSFAYDWSGRHDDALRLRYRLLPLAEQAERPIWLASACIALGAFLASATMNPEAGLPYLQRARAIWAGQDMRPSALVATAQTVLALDMLGRHDEAYQVLRTDVAREGAMDMVGPYRARLSTALLGVGRLDEAEQWLDAARQHPPKDGFPIEPLMRVRLRCAQQRHADARALAEQEVDRPLTHSRSIYDQVTLLDQLRTACEALGDSAAAEQAARAAREAYLPLLGRSLRARYVSEQAANSGHGELAEPSERDLRRLEELQRAVAARADLPLAPAAAPASAPQPKVPRFLAHVAHELRTPIGGMMGLSSLLLMSDLDDKQRRYATALKSSAHTLIQLVNDVLDLAKIESGQFVFNLEPLEPRGWLAESVEPFVALGDLKGVKVLTAIDEPLPGKLVADPLRLRQVLSNLLSNALKFTRRAGGGDARRPPGRRARPLGLAGGGAGQRHGHRRRRDRQAVRGVHAGARTDRARSWRHRARPGAVQAAGAAHGRHDRRQQQARRGQPVLVRRRGRRRHGSQRRRLAARRGLGDRGLLVRGRVEPLEAIVEQRVQLAHALGTQLRVQCQLRLLPGPLAFGAQRTAGVGRLDQAAARIHARPERDPAGRQHRLQVARQRRRLEAHALRQVGRPDRPELDHVRQQRVLRVLQAGGGDVAVVVTRHGAAQLPQLQVGAALRALRCRGVDCHDSIVYATLAAAQTSGEAMAKLSDTEASAVLAQWQADEARVRARMSEAGGKAGFSRPAQVAHLTGLQFFEGMFSGELPYPPINETLDFLAVHMEPGYAVFQGRPQLRHYNPMGTVHGGWFATLLDSCVACAVHTALPAGKAYTTVELKINLVRALTDKVPLVRAEGRLIHLGRSMGTADGRLVGHDGTLYAHASTTCFIMELPKPADARP